MSCTRAIAAIAAGAAVLATAGVTVPSGAGASSTAGTISASRHYVLHSDPVTLTGSESRTLPLYRSLDGGRYSRIGWAYASHGRYSRTIHPVPGYLNRYKIGTSTQHVNVHSTACTPPTNLAGPQAWFNVRGAATSNLGTHWTRLICAAAPGSTIELSVMNLSGGSTSTNAFVAALRNVALLRGVHVSVLVRPVIYAATPTPGVWTWAQFRSAFSFASVHWCAYGCTTTGPDAPMHYKFMTISKLTSGGSAVVSSSLNVTPQQFDRQNGSAIYVYDDPALYAALHAAHLRAVQRIPVSAGQQPVGWQYTTRGVAYAFDPSTIDTDPFTDELRTLTCRPGDYVDAINANITRSRLIRQLNRLQAEGCNVAAITEQDYLSPAIEFRIRHAYTHDRFIVIHAHDATGAVRNEVLAGSELFRPSALMHEEQMLRVRYTPIEIPFANWFNYMWDRAT